MSKRQAESIDDVRKTTPKKNEQDTAGTHDMEIDEEMGEFEDPYGDDFESEEEILEVGDSEDEEEEEDEDMEEESSGKSKALQTIQEDEELEAKESVKKPSQSLKTYLPYLGGNSETLEPDLTAYDMYHPFSVKFPSLSFDIIQDSLGEERRTYPHTTYLVTGTQASRPRDNEITVMKLSDLSKTLVREDESDGESDDDDEYTDPILEYKSLPTPHTTNRIRMNPHARVTGEQFAASMADNGEVFIWDITPHVKSFDTPGLKIEKAMNRPAHTIRSHGNVEGYAIGWSPLVQTGALLSGDCDGRIFHTKRTQSGWSTEKTPFTAGDVSRRNKSIEDIQWSPSEEKIFASCGADGFIRIWDLRSKSRTPQISVKASNTDVNVISWSSKKDYLLCSGHDDGRFGVWDLRNFGSKNPSVDASVAVFDFHKKPITSIEFSPQDESLICVSSEDSTVTIWDMAVEADDEEIKQQKSQSAELKDIPPQLLFLHWQEDAKEVHWNKQIPGHLAATGSSGFSVFKTISV
ncbi:ribosome assembly protein Rrb1p [Trichomonascus vanleenenianus]|uniref:ribosome biosynthesis protein RRB1 n=1 Tax=Trichomonascus vanleenenianus TaxID=2268995 RepID=UPI003ECA7B06